MQSVRRAVLRSAVSASAQVARATSTSTTPLVRSVAAKAVRMPVSNLAIAARYFSQTARVANAEEESSPAAATEAPAAATPSDDPTPHGLFIRNIVFDASEANLQEAFEHYGSVNKTIIARDARGMSKGYGFVFFESAEARQKAIEEANGSFWHGRRLIVLERSPRQPRQGLDGPPGVRTSQPTRDPTDSLYIGNLPYETTDADLNVVFREVTGLKAVRVAVDRATGWPRGFAHADFDTVENATSGLEFLKDKQIGARTLRVDYASPSKSVSQRGFRGRKDEGAEEAFKE